MKRKKKLSLVQTGNAQQSNTIKHVLVSNHVDIAEWPSGIKHV